LLHEADGRFDVGHDERCIHAQDAPACAAQRAVPPRVSGNKARVVRAIHFHGQAHGRSAEVCDVPPDDKLPPEANA
jgi:hypothetical protein